MAFKKIYTNREGAVTVVKGKNDVFNSFIKIKDKTYALEKIINSKKAIYMKEDDWSKKYKVSDELQNVTNICKRVSCGVFGQQFDVRAERDNKRPIDGRIFLQITYKAECNKDGVMKDWHGRKWYLSEHMTEDEVIKTLFVAFKSVVEHEIMEGFKVDDKILFNPHLSYIELLAISDREVKREEQAH